ncbi:hypothetical protein BSLG_009536 [Batrachochytrium salamandrivorans]|nr:hypothetical protein BSLG_009536 [Batrachochytrium salamandrivorans]
MASAATTVTVTAASSPPSESAESHPPVCNEPGAMLWHYWRSQQSGSSINDTSKSISSNNQLHVASPLLRPALAAALADHNPHGDTLQLIDIYVMASYIQAALDATPHNLLKYPSNTKRHSFTSSTSNVVLIDATAPPVSLSLLQEALCSITDSVTSHHLLSQLKYVQVSTAADLVAQLWAVGGLINPIHRGVIPLATSEDQPSTPVVVPCVIIYARSPMMWIRMRSHELRALSQAISYLSRHLGISIVCWYLRERDHQRWKTWLPK